MAYKGKIDILSPTTFFDAGEYGSAIMSINQEQLITDLPDPIDEENPPTFTTEYQGNSVQIDIPVTDLKPYVEFIFSGFCEQGFIIEILHNWDENDIVVGNSPISVGVGDEAFEIVNAIVSRVNGDASIDYTANNETGDEVGVPITLRLTSDAVEYRYSDSVSIYTQDENYFIDGYGISVDEDNKNFDNSPLMSNFRSSLVSGIAADGSIELSASTAGGIADNQIKFISEVVGTSGNTDIDFTSSIGTDYLYSNPITISGGADTGSAITESIPININGSEFATFTLTQGETAVEVATNIKAACDAVGSGTYTFTRSGSTIEVTATSTFATLSLGTPSSLRLLWNSVDVNEI